MGILRILLAIAIVIAHANTVGNFPVLGITALNDIFVLKSFFIISGFYMWMILNEKYIGKNNNYTLFITNRFLRIYPVYWTVLITAILFDLIQAVFFKHSPNIISRFICFCPLFSPFVNFSLLFSNLFIFGQDVISFLGINSNKGSFIICGNDALLNTFMYLPQSWSLASELLFYVVVPVLAKRNLSLTIIIIGIMLAIKFYFYSRGYDLLTWRFFPYVFTFFLLGGISYFIYNKIKKYTFSKKMLSVIWVGLLLIIIFYQYVSANNIKQLLYYTIFTAALPFIFHLTKNYKLDRYIGELSYPLFTAQFLVFAILKLVPLPHKYFGINSVILCTILAVIIYHFVTIPIERIRQSRVKLKKSKDMAMPASWK